MIERNDRSERLKLVQDLLLAILLSVASGYRLTVGEIHDLRALDDWPDAKIGGVILYYNEKLAGFQ